MSLSNPKISNPCKKFYRFKSDEKKVVYWDKEFNNGEGKNTGANIELILPARFIVLDGIS